MARRIALVATALVATALAACSTTATWAPPRADASANPGPTTPAPPPVITLDFAGDSHFDGRTLTLLEKNPDTAFGPIASELSSADFSMVNLETPVTTRGTPEPKEFHFRAPPTAYKAVKAAGIDLVTLANNHTLDYGRVGLTDTINYAKAANVPFVGVGENAADAYRPWVTEIKGVKIAFLGFSQITELASTWSAEDNRSGIAMAFDTKRALAAVKAARAKADVVVVFMHWGQEYNQCPISPQKTFAKQVADAGADIIIGAHVHVLQGSGWLGHTFVAYGMSNFLWHYNDAGSNDTGVMRITLTGSKITSTQFLPAYINRTTGQPELVSGSEATRISKKFADLRGCTGLAASSS
jgi:poly-gamma-glutamate capsule biosynthesis protein CapA/YwtB (metallophosphatase superfamily)